MFKVVIIGDALNKYLYVTSIFFIQNHLKQKYYFEDDEDTSANKIELNFWNKGS